LNTATIDLNKLPNLIFIDGVPSKLLGGISQTLYNIFDGYPSSKLYAICDKNQLNEINESSLKANVINFNYSSLLFKIKPFTFFNAWLKYIDLFIREIIAGYYINKNKLPKTAILFVCTTNIEKLQIAKKIFIQNKFHLVSYYMDDWMGDSKLSWLNGNAQDYVQWTLENASGRLMISEYLDKTLVERYKLTLKPSLIIHNPVDFIERSLNKKVHENKEIYKIGYAGSIWPMHKDAIVKVAQAVENINKSTSQNINFDIYSKQFFWDFNKDYLNYLGTNYKGFLNYDELYNTLYQYDILIVASSFLHAYENFSRSSVQTKITDYLNVHVPILSIGPSDGASNLFIKKWECGFVWDETSSMSLEEYIRYIISHPELSIKKVENGKNILREKYTKQVVQKDMYTFLSQF